MFKTFLAALFAGWLLATPALAVDIRFTEGYIQARNGNPEGAIAIWEPLAENGHVRAQYELGRLYAESEDMDRNPELAFKWWLKAAEAGHKQSQVHIADMYREGIGTEPDVEKSFAWMMHAAKRGIIPAEVGLAKYYFEGYGTERDEKESMFWLMVAMMSGGMPDTSIGLEMSKTFDRYEMDDIRARADAWLESGILP